MLNYSVAELRIIKKCINLVYIYILSNYGKQFSEVFISLNNNAIKFVLYCFGDRIKIFI